MLSIRMLADQVLVRRHVPPLRAGRLHVPTSAQRAPTTGRVLAVGPDVKHVAVGDEIVHGKYVGEDLSLDAAAHLVLVEADVLGILSTIEDRAAADADVSALDEVESNGGTPAQGPYPATLAGLDEFLADLDAADDARLPPVDIGGAR